MVVEPLPEPVTSPPDCTGLELGRIAFEAYASSIGGKVPRWEDVPDVPRAAFEAAGYAVAAACLDPRAPMPNPVSRGAAKMLRTVAHGRAYVGAARPADAPSPEPAAPVDDPAAPPVRKRKCKMHEGGSYRGKVEIADNVDTIEYEGRTYHRTKVDTFQAAEPEVAPDPESVPEPEPTPPAEAPPAPDEGESVVRHG